MADINQTKKENWVILDEDGQQAFDFDSFVNVTIKNEAKVISAPIENGSFVSYNLVQTPTELNCTIAKRGDFNELNAVIQSLQEYSKNTQLLSVITPEQEYKNMKLTKFAYDRSAENGIDLLVVECSFQEVRQVATQYTNSKLRRRANRGRQQNKDTSIMKMGQDGVTNVKNKLSAEIQALYTTIDNNK